MPLLETLATTWTAASWGVPVFEHVSNGAAFLVNAPIYARWIGLAYLVIVLTVMYLLQQSNVEKRQANALLRQSNVLLQQLVTLNQNLRDNSAGKTVFY